MAIPNTIRVPSSLGEFDNSQAAQGAALMPYRALIIGQKIASGTSAANSLLQVTNEVQVVAAAGRGSILHRQYKAWREKNKSTELWIGLLADSASGVHASGTLALSGTATEAGTLALRVGGYPINVAVASGDTAATIATAVGAAVGKYATGTITLSAADAADNVTIGATTFVGTTGAVVAGAATYSVDTGNPQAATSLAAQINAHAVASLHVFATANSAVVTLFAQYGGSAGNSIVLTTTDAIDLAVSGSGTLSGATDDTDLPVYCTVSSGTVTFKARNRGTAANEIDLRVNYQLGEKTPAGITATVTAMASGATNPSLTSLITAMGDTQFHVITMACTDATSLASIETELADRFTYSRQIDGVCYSSKEDTFAVRATLGNSRNSPHSVIVRTRKSPTPSFEEAAQVAAAVAYEAAADPALPFTTVTLPTVLAPAVAERETFEERDLLLHDGISTTKVAAGDVVQIERLITTYKTNAAGSPDTSYLDANTMHTLMYLRYSFRAWILAKFPRAKLVSDGTRARAGQKIVTPKLAKAEAISWFREMEGKVLVENFDQFKTDLQVTRNVDDPNRLDFILPPDLANQFLVSAFTIQFRL